MLFLNFNTKFINFIYQSTFLLVEIMKVEHFEDVDQISGVTKIQSRN